MSETSSLPPTENRGEFAAARSSRVLDWIGVAGGLSLAERVRILALELATKQGYSLDEAERLCPSAEVSRV